MFVVANVCLDTPVVGFADTNIGSRFYEQNATVDCVTGYEFPDGEVTKAITCDDTTTGVQWTDAGYETCQCMYLTCLANFYH